MSRPNLPVRVIVAEDGGEQVSISNVRERDDAHVEMRLLDWTGWRDGAPVRANPSDIPGGDGAYDAPPLLGARTVTLKGVCYPPDVAALVDRGDLIGRLLQGARRSGTVAVQLLDGRWWFCRIRLGAETLWKETHAYPTPRAEWSMSLYAADPKRYALDESSVTTTPYEPSGGFAWPLVFPIDFGPLGGSGLVQLHNGGKVETGARITIPGPCSNPLVKQPETGIRLAFRTSLAAGQSIDIDTAARSVVRENGAPWAWTLTSDSDFPLLPEGDSSLLFLTDSGTPQMTVAWSDARP